MRIVMDIMVRKKEMCWVWVVVWKGNGKERWRIIGEGKLDGVWIVES